MDRFPSRVMSILPREMKKARFALEINRIFRDKTIKEKYKMGYRSTVAYTIRFTPTPPNNTDSPTDEEVSKCRLSFYTFLAEAKVKHSGALTDSCMMIDEPNMALNFIADTVKWYETYEDVMVHEELISLSKEWADSDGDKSNLNIGGLFMRIGEEMDDLVEEGWGEHDWDWLSIHREIVCDWK